MRAQVYKFNCSGNGACGNILTVLESLIDDAVSVADPGFAIETKHRDDAGCFGVWGMTAQPSVHANELRVRETDHKIEMVAGAGDSRLQQSVTQSTKRNDAVFERSGFLHPVFTPKGRCVTESFPADHPHQQGIFSAWVKTAHDESG